MRILKEVAEFFKAQNVNAYLVGGSVRDQVLGRAMNDVDLTIEGDASALARAFANATGGAFYLMDAEHNVARVLLGKRYVDFAELRGELTQDLSMRDFALNAMARPLASAVAATGPGTDGVIDPFHGLQDLAARQVRVVSDDSFRDPVRLLRGVRIAGEFEYAIEAHTLELMRRHAPMLAHAPMERVRDEFFKILALADVVVRLRQMDALGLLAALLPEVSALKGVEQSEAHVHDAFEHTVHSVDELVQIQARGYADVADGGWLPELATHFAHTVSAERARGTLLRLITLLHDTGKAVTRSIDTQGLIHFYAHEVRGAQIVEEIARRLRLSNAEMEIATHVVEHHLRPPQLARAAQITNRAVYRFFRDLGSNGIDVCVLALADTRAKAAPVVAPDKVVRLRAVLSILLERYYHAPEKVVAPPALVNGRTLMAELALPPGPEVGRLLEAIREAQAEGEVTTREQAVALAHRLLKEPDAGGTKPNR